MRAIKRADELGFYGCYAADETWHKDLWLLFAAAAARTRRNIRFGPSVSGVVLREPTLIAQAAATLDELTDGRAEVVLGSGNFGLLAQYDISGNRPSRCPGSRRASKSSTLLDDGAITFDGEFFKYHGLFTFARPVQERLPVKIGSMRGPKSFEVAGEFSDGCHHCLSYTRQAYEYGFEHFRAGAERAGKNPDDLDFAAWVVTAIGRDSAAAKQAARSMVGIYASSMPPEQLERNGVDPAGAHPHRGSHERRGPGQER